jgi:hypothetical protein
VAAGPQGQLQQQQTPFRSPSLTLDLSDLPSAAEGAAAEAAAVLPPRVSVGRADSLARAGSLALRPVQPPSTAVFGWGRNDCGEWYKS